MQTEPLTEPGTFMPLVSAVTGVTTLSAEGSGTGGSLFLVLTYPGHFFAFVTVVTGVPVVVVLPLAQVMIPPAARFSVGNATEEPPVLAPPLSTHPVSWMLPATV